MLLGLYSVFCSYSVVYAAVAHSVIITEHKVPRAVLNGTEHVVLDCVYTVKPDATRGLVVTWYFNNSPSPMYQWISGQPPRTIGPLKSRIRLGYEATADDDALAKYRALYISRPTIELTGYYKCVVSTYTDEDFMIKEMTVYAPGEHLHMKRTKTGSDTVNISCTISRVFPLPKMQLYKIDGNGTETKNSTLDIAILDHKNDGAYDVTAWTLFSESELPSGAVFFCQVIIPGTPYNVTKRFIYNPGDSESWMAADNFACSGKSSRTLQWTVIVWLLATAISH